MPSIPQSQPPKLSRFQVIALDSMTHDVLGLVEIVAKNVYRAKRRAEIALILDGKISHRSPYLLRSRKIGEE